MIKNIVLGIDAGGSKTLALAAGLDGQILGRAQGGPANIHAAGREAAVAAMDDAVRRALQMANAGVGQVRAVCIGAAGADRQEDRAVWNTWVQQLFPGAIVSITNDAFIVLAAGVPDSWGLVVISGTGSIAYGRDREGRVSRAGGWGYLMGDEGSNYAIGQAALRAVTRAVDGRGPGTALVEAILAHWNLSEPAGLVKKVYEDLPRREFVRLGKVVEATAAAGDPVAAGILEEAGRELALAARAVAARLEFTGPIPCALAGSVLVFGQWVRPAFLRAAVELGLSLDPVALVTEPAQGAVQLAIEKIPGK